MLLNYKNHNKAISHPVTMRGGFTLIEILVAVFIIAIMATIVIPNLKPRQPKAERESFIAQLNALTRLALNTAMMTNKTHKIFFDFEKKKIQLQVEADAKDSSGEPTFVPAKGAYIHTSISWPKNLEVRNFYVEGFDEMERWGGRTMGQVWFFVVPAGLAQQVTINIVDTIDRVNRKPRPVGLVLNPFSAHFKEYDTFQK